MKSIAIETNFNSLKPIFGSGGSPPFYDPNDIHEHIWKKGKLGIEDDPKRATFSKEKMSIRDCTYCKICHKIKNEQKLVLNSKNTVDDILFINKQNTTVSYKPIINYVVNTILLEKINKDKEEAVNVSVNKILFHEQEGIFDNYVIIEKQ